VSHPTTIDNALVHCDVAGFVLVGTKTYRLQGNGGAPLGCFGDRFTIRELDIRTRTVYDGQQVSQKRAEKCVWAN
jgi:hypothetical protein